MLEEARASRAAEANAKVGAMLLAQVAHLKYRQDRYADAEALATQALALVRTARDDDVQALCLQVLGVCALRLGRLAEAKRHFERAQQHALAASSPRKAAAMLHNLAVVERAMGHTDEAIVLFLDAAIARHKLLGDVAGEARCLRQSGAGVLEQGAA